MRYLLPDDVAFEARALAARGLADAEPLGIGELRRWMWVLRVGNGALHIAVKGNAHADEPAGTVTCFQFARWLAEQPAGQELAEKFTFHLLPTANPRGLERNRGWLGAEEPNLVTWFRYVRRDAPPEDREFGYGETPEQAAHPECAAWHAYLDLLPRLDGYVSLHSMAFSGGAWFLGLLDDVERRADLLDALRGAALRRGLPLHDEDRGGRKGFYRIGPGFHTAPTREGMRAFFAASGDETAMDWLRLNSMQVVQLRHATPVALVSELPLWWDPELANMKPVEARRWEVDVRGANGLEETAAELEAIGKASEDDVNGQGLRSLNYMLQHLRSTAGAQRRLAANWGDRPATRRDVAAGELAVLHAHAANAAMALRLRQQAGRPPDDRWVLALLNRVAAIEQRFDLQPLSLPQQVDLHLAMLRLLAEHLLVTAEVGGRE